MKENEKIKQIRKALGLTQQEMADSIGVSKQYFSKVENGLTTLSKEKATKLCNKFGVSLDWLLSDKGGMFIKENEITDKLLADIDNLSGVSGILGAYSVYIEMIFPIIEEAHPKAIIKDKVTTVSKIFIDDLFKKDDVKKGYNEIREILKEKLSHSEYKEKVLNLYYKSYVERCEKNN